MLVGLLVAFTGCDGDFEEINTDPKKRSQSKKKLLRSKRRKSLFRKKRPKQQSLPRKRLKRLLKNLKMNHLRLRSLSKKKTLNLRHLKLGSHRNQTTHLKAKSNNLLKNQLRLLLTTKSLKLNLLHLIQKKPKKPLHKGKKMLQEM